MVSGRADVQLDFWGHLDLEVHPEGRVDLDVHGGLPENQSVI